MKVSMDNAGLITIKAETGVEAYALKQWMNKASIKVVDSMRDETTYTRGSMLKVIADEEERP